MKKNRTKENFYIILRIAVGIMFILNVVGIFIVNDDGQQSRLAFNAFQSLLFIIVSTIPGVIEKKGKVNIPDFMEVIFIIMCICHFVLGEMVRFYVIFTWWDSMLHTFSGSMIAILGFSLVNSVNQEKNNMIVMPIFVAIFAVCFSVTIGVLWEIVEFSTDYFTGSNMQRYMNSTTLVPFEGRIALRDTMKDLILDTIGACVISIIGFLNMRKDKLAFQRWTIRRDQIIDKMNKVS